MQPIRFFIWALVAGALLTACVPKNEYLQLEASLNATRSQLADSTAEHERTADVLAACRKKLDQLHSARDELQMQCDELEIRLGNQADRVRTLEAELARGQSIIQLQEKVIGELEATRRSIEVQLQDQIADQQVVIEEMAGKLKVTFIDKILFNSGSASINPEGRSLLAAIAPSLRRVADHEIVVEGHTDEVPIGPDLVVRYPTNWELAAARATAVVRFLQEQAGLPPERLTASAFSFYRPVAGNDDVDGRRQNRRIELLLVPRASAHEGAPPPAPTP